MLTYSCMCSSIFFNQRTRELGAHIHTQKQPLSKCFCLCQRSFCVVNTYSLCLCVFYFCAVDSLLEATTSTHFFDFLQILFSWGNCDMFFFSSSRLKYYEYLTKDRGEVWTLQGLLSVSMFIVLFIVP